MRMLQVAGAAMIALAATPAAAQPADQPEPKWVWGVTIGWPYYREPSTHQRNLEPLLDGTAWRTSIADYPPEALAAGIGGSVPVRVSVDASGALTGCEILDKGPKPPAVLRDAACPITRKYGRFIPAISAEGKPVAAQIDLTVGFYRTDPKAMPAPPPPPRQH